MDIAKLKENPIRVAIGVALTITIVICISLALRSSPIKQCHYSRVQPSLEAPIQVASSNFTALANFSGYLQVVKGNDRYFLPLKLTSLSIEGNESRPVINLWTDCAKLSLQGILGSSRVYEYQFMDVLLDEACEDIGQSRHFVVKTDGISHGFSEGYACNKERLLFSEPFSKPLSMLLVESLSFEINGDPEKIRQGQFSKPSRSCK